MVKWIRLLGFTLGLSVVGVPGEGAGRDAATSIDASGVYRSAVRILCSRAGAPMETLAVSLSRLGFRRDKEGWEAGDAQGTTTVTVVDGKSWFSVVGYYPKTISPLPGSLITSLTQRAKSVKFDAPSEVLFEFDEGAAVFSASSEPLCSQTEYLILAIADGSWVESRTFIALPRR
jgi:hypothetical protein